MSDQRRGRDDEEPEEMVAAPEAGRAIEGSLDTEILPPERVHGVVENDMLQGKADPDVPRDAGTVPSGRGEGQSAV